MLFAQKLELVDLTATIHLEPYLVFMNEKERRLYQVYKEWTEDENLKEDPAQLFLLKSKATKAFLNHDIFKAYDVLVDLGWICFPNVEQAKFYYEKALDLSKRYLSIQERNAYASIIYNNLTTLYFINEQYDRTKKCFAKGAKYIKDEDFSRRKEFFEKFMNNRYVFDPNWYEQIKKELNDHPKDLFFRYAFQKICVISSHWKEAYEQEVYFSTKQYLEQTKA